MYDYLCITSGIFIMSFQSAYGLAVDSSIDTVLTPWIPELCRLLFYDEIFLEQIPTGIRLSKWIKNVLIGVRGQDQEFPVCYGTRHWSFLQSYVLSSLEFWLEAITGYWIGPWIFWLHYSWSHYTNGLLCRPDSRHRWIVLQKLFLDEWIPLNCIGLHLDSDIFVLYPRLRLEIYQYWTLVE